MYRAEHARQREVLLSQPWIDWGSGLPLGILSEIFAHVPARQRQQLGCVCSRWREAALPLPKRLRFRTSVWRDHPATPIDVPSLRVTFQGLVGLQLTGSWLMPHQLASRDFLACLPPTLESLEVEWLTLLNSAHNDISELDKWLLHRFGTEVRRCCPRLTELGLHIRLRYRISLTLLPRGVRHVMLAGLLTPTLAEILVKLDTELPFVLRAEDLRAIPRTDQLTSLGNVALLSSQDFRDVARVGQGLVHLRTAFLNQLELTVPAAMELRDATQALRKWEATFLYALRPLKPFVMRSDVNQHYLNTSSFNIKRGGHNLEVSFIDRSPWYKVRVALDMCWWLASQAILVRLSLGPTSPVYLANLLTTAHLSIRHERAMVALGLL